MNIVEYEKRVKRYAHVKNRGKISAEALMEAFKDTKIFKQLDNPASVVNRVVMSPFFTDLCLSHNEPTEKERAYASRQSSVTPEIVTN